MMRNGSFVLLQILLFVILGVLNDSGNTEWEGNR